jgi:hypothetical protein
LIYLDTSVVAPFYWQEHLSEVVQALLRNEIEVALSQFVEKSQFIAPILGVSDPQSPPELGDLGGECNVFAIRWDISHNPRSSRGKAFVPSGRSLSQLKRAWVRG